MTQALKPDLCIIGGGAAGVAAALAAVRTGASTILVEKARLGGAHLYSGGIAARALCAAATMMSRIAEVEAFGISVARPKADLFQVREHLHRAVASVAPDYAAQRLGGLGIQVIQNAASFTSPDVLATEDFEVKAGAFLVATGSLPAAPAIDGLAEAAYLTHESLFELTVLPRHLIILGATAHDLPLAQAYRRLGAEVTLLAAGTLLPDEDQECVDVLRLSLARDGVTLRENATPKTVVRQRGKVTVDVDADTIEGSHLVVGARRPAIDGLGLDRAEVTRGTAEIKVDARLKTANSRIYAVGDAIGGQTAHDARRQAVRVVETIGGQSDSDQQDVPVRVVHTDPPLAHAGLGETEAKARRIGVVVLRWPFAHNDVAVASRRLAGHVKVVVAPTGRILGVTIVGARADDLISPWVLAIANGLDIHAVAALVSPYPTFGETSLDAAKGFEAVGLTPSRLRRIMGKIRR